MAQENKLLARNNKTGLRLFAKRQLRFPCRNEADRRAALVTPKRCAWAVRLFGSGREAAN
jgi:hypothetical protein